MIDHGLVTEWLIELLKTDNGNFDVGDHMAPPGADARVAPYFVVWGIAGGSFDGPPLHDPEGDHSIVYQVDAVGFLRPQAQALAARARNMITGRLPNGGYISALASPAGMSIHDRISDGSSGGVIVEGTAPDEIYSAPNRYVLTVTPA
jgi:hypothetical protein